MSNTSSSWNTLKDTTTQGWNNSAFGVQVEDMSFGFSGAYKNAKSLAVSGYSQTISRFEEAGGNLEELFESQQYEELADAAGSAALNYLNSKIERLKTLWTTPTKTNLGALIGEISPYALSPKEAGKALISKLRDLLAYLTGVQSGDNWKDLVNNIGLDAASSLLGDPAFISAASQLRAVQAFGNILSGCATAVDTVSKILNVVESVLPWSEITSAFALLFYSGGATSAEGTAKITEETEKIVQRLLALAMHALKKLAFKVEISVPSLLMGAMNTISVKEAVSSYGPAATWLQTVFSDEFYQETINSYRWETSIQSSLRDTLGTLDSWSKFDFIKTETEWGEMLKSKFLSNLVQNYMYGTDGASGIIAQAKAAAHITTYGSGTILWGYANEYSVSNIPSSTTTIGTTVSASSATSSISTLDLILNENSDDNPIRDEIAIRTISKKIYEAL